MSWTDNIQSNLIITTGDGKQFSPLYTISSRSKEFNFTEFNFPGLDGTLVDRRRPKGMRYTLNVVFQGDDHLDQVEVFNTSSNDQRPWSVFHPMYGTLSVQPTSIKFDSSALNNTKVSIDVVETISSKPPFISFDEKDKISFEVERLKTLSIESVSNEFDFYPTGVKVLSKSNIENSFSIADLSRKGSDEATEYYNVYQSALASLDAVVAITSITATRISTFFSYPSLFTDGVKSKVSMMKDQYEKVKLSIPFILKKEEKKDFEFTVSTIMSSMCSAVGSGVKELSSSSDILDVSDTLLSTYDDIVSTLDGLSSTTGGAIDSYLPDPDTMLTLDSLVTFTISSLFTIALDSKQKRVVILTEDSDPFTLAHKYYGAEASDEFLDLFLDQNDIGMNELFEIKKGKEVVYFV